MQGIHLFLFITIIVESISYIYLYYKKTLKNRVFLAMLSHLAFFLVPLRLLVMLKESSYDEQLMVKIFENYVIGDNIQYPAGVLFLVFSHLIILLTNINFARNFIVMVFNIIYFYNICKSMNNIGIETQNQLIYLYILVCIDWLIIPLGYFRPTIFSFLALSTFIHAISTFFKPESSNSFSSFIILYISIVILFTHLIGFSVLYLFIFILYTVLTLSNKYIELRILLKYNLLITNTLIPTIFIMYRRFFETLLFLKEIDKRGKILNIIFIITILLIILINIFIIILDSNSTKKHIKKRYIQIKNKINYKITRIFFIITFIFISLIISIRNYKLILPLLKFYKTNVLLAFSHLPKFILVILLLVILLSVRRTKNENKEELKEPIYFSSILSLTFLISFVINIVFTSFLLSVKTEKFNNWSFRLFQLTFPFSIFSVLPISRFAKQSINNVFSHLFILFIFLSSIFRIIPIIYII